MPKKLTVKKVLNRAKSKDKNIVEEMIKGIDNTKFNKILKKIGLQSK